LKHKILFLVSGSIAAYKACHLISRLTQAGNEVEVVATPWALEFVGEATLEGLTGRPVHQAMFGSGAYMSHIHLARWADLVIICPATANTINKLANGVGDDLLTTLFLAHDFSKPWLIAPAMNTKMYQHPATRESLKKLELMGCKILETESGVLACGEIGEGKLLDPELLFLAIETELKLVKTQSPPQKPRKPITYNEVPHILITSGGTEEPIDRVRSITNTSTGETGRVLAEVLSGLGYEVTLLKARLALGPRTTRSELHIKEFKTFQDLKKMLEGELRSNHFVAIIHAAAVSDYHVEHDEHGMKNKIESSSDTLVLRLRRNPKLIDEFRSLSKNPQIKVVGFKFTAADLNQDSQEMLRDKMTRIAQTGSIDYLVTNDLSTYPDWELHKIQRLTVETIARGKDRFQLGFILEQALFRK
jgi:phosphopantothenoylcysteine decarboxylase/phosphopantothenate--cysteine ligase